MAFETSIDLDRDALARMAVLAAVGVRWMENIADHRRSVAPMGVMAGAAFAEFTRSVGMLWLNRRQGMTAQAERLGILGQQGRIGGLVRLMAGLTLTLGVRLMGIFEFLGHILVTGEAGFRETALEESGVVGRMWVMTGEAFSFPNWLVHPSLTVFRGRILMTGVTEIFHLLPKQAGISCHMGVVAVTAFTLRGGWMFDALLKNGPIMTLETIDSRPGSSLNREKHNDSRGQGHYRTQRTRQRHHFALPS
jgi:hypothetical protein